MSIEQDREFYFLQQLLQAPGQTVKKFEGTKAKPKGLDLDGPAKKAVESRLIGAGFVTVAGKGPAKAFSLTPSGREHFKTLTPFPRPAPPNLKLKAFILLSLLGEGDGPVTLKRLTSILKPAIAKSLDATKEALPPLLDVLVNDRAVEKSTGDGDAPDERVLYRLTNAGKQEIVRQRQHADIVFTLKGAAINQLLEYAGARMAASDQPPAHVTRTESTAGNHAVTPNGSISDDELIRDAKSLMSTRGSNGMLPIFELRRHVRQKFGEHAAGPEEFDKRLKRLRGQRLDLISLFDPSAFSRDQLNEGVQGSGELFFYVRNPR